MLAGHASKRSNKTTSSGKVPIPIGSIYLQDHSSWWVVHKPWLIVFRPLRSELFSSPSKWLKRRINPGHLEVVGARPPSMAITLLESFSPCNSWIPPNRPKPNWKGLVCNHPVPDVSCRACFCLGIFITNWVKRIFTIQGGPQNSVINGVMTLF